MCKFIFCLSLQTLFAVYALTTDENLELRSVLPNAEIYNSLQIAKPEYKTEVLVKSYKDNCWTLEVNVYETLPSKTVLLRHTATIQTGGGCPVNEKTLSSRLHENDREYIIADSEINGPIQDFFSVNDDQYDNFLAEKKRIMRSR
jgi:hypothetical protein